MKKINFKIPTLIHCVVRDKKREREKQTAKLNYQFSFIDVGPHLDHRRERLKEGKEGEMLLN